MLSPTTDPSVAMLTGLPLETTDGRNHLGLRGHHRRNVGNSERIGSVVAGSALAAYGLLRGGIGGWATALLGAAIVHRGGTGHCELYHALGVNTAKSHVAGASLVGNDGIRADKSLTINRPPAELWRYWRDFTNLPRFMKHLESVEILDADGKRSRWTAKAPAGFKVSWEAEIVNEKEGEMISWRSLPGADVDNAGSVWFVPEPHGQGTQVRVQLMYRPPAGKLGALIAKLFGEEPTQQITEDLRRFKVVMETGVIPTLNGQASGRGHD